MKKRHKNAGRREEKRSRSGPAPGASGADVQLEKAKAHEQAGQLAEAEAVYREILAAHPDHAGALYHFGLLAVQVGQAAIALQLFDRAIEVNPAYAEAHASRGNALYALGQHDAALASFDRAIQLQPDYADAHYNRGIALHVLLRYDAAIESYDQAIHLRPEHAEAYNNRGGALFALEEYEAALQSYDNAIRLKPEFADAEHNRRHILHLLAQQHAMSDPIGKTGSSGRDLVFYCGPTDEMWNPETARVKGIGGSEEAVVWLSRLLRERGWNVTVYCNCGPQAKDYDGVWWKPFWMWNHRDRQDVTVLWRRPQLADLEINSGKVVLDLHDTVPESDMTAERLLRVQKIFVKSAFHRSLYPNIPDAKFVVIPNGIDTALFDGAAARDPRLMINTSSADRSLAAFVDCFAEISRQVPQAKAQWAYGWRVWDAVYSADTQRLQWKAKLHARMLELGMEERGRLSHDEVAKLYHQASIFAYPTEFAEIDCISLSKAMAAGAIPITTDFAALGEKAGHGGVFLHSARTREDWARPGQSYFEMTDSQQKAEFVEAAVRLLRNPPSEAEREPMRAWARQTFDWARVADRWDEVLAAPAAASN